MIHRSIAWCLGLTALFILVGVPFRDLSRTRSLSRPTRPGMLQLVSIKPPAMGKAPEAWRDGDTVVQVSGLDTTETDPTLPGPWRHGLAPATVLRLSPSRRAIELRWGFSCTATDQTLTIRNNDETVSIAAVPLGTNRGKTIIPPHESEAILSLEFSHHVSPGAETRAITVTFDSLELRRL